MARHVAACAKCAALLERERMLTAALRRLASSVDAPPPDPRQELALLARFDEVPSRARSGARRPIRAGLAAAGIFLGAVVVWEAANARLPRPVGPEMSGGIAPGRIPVPEPAPPTEAGRVQTDTTPEMPLAEIRAGASLDASDFVVWPGAAAWPGFESGELVRVEIPVAALPLSWPARHEQPAAFVQADVLVGQDGIVRAVRLLQ
jgi:hypothetical protein